MFGYINSLAPKDNNFFMFSQNYSNFCYTKIFVTKSENIRPCNRRVLPLNASDHRSGGLPQSVKKADFIIISVLFLLAVILYIIFSIYSKNVTDNVSAEILINGQIVKTVSLDTDKIFTISELPNIKFEIKDKKIRFLESDCPDKICVNTGFIGNAGQTAVCLPNLASLKIVSSDKEKYEYDALTN